jgi:uncharacterized RDD family membrane protein YckC
MQKYNTFWPRFWAVLVDSLIFLPIGILDNYLNSAERGLFILIVWAIVSHTVYWLYSVILHARYGQTLGKRVMRVKVLDFNEERLPTLRQAFIRDINYIFLYTFSLGYFIYLVFTGQNTSETEATSLPDQIMIWAAFGWFLLEIITMATNDKRRAFHDYIAKTVVVRTN